MWKGAQGLAEDIRYYGRWMRDEAESRIGHLYPRVEVTEALAAKRDDLKPYVGQELTVIAWLWARTVASPDPMMRGAHVPLVRSFVLSSKKTKPAWVEPKIDRRAGRYRFSVRPGSGTPPDGTVNRRGGRCLLTGTAIPFSYVRAEGKAGRMGEHLMAVVAEGARGRVYLCPTLAQSDSACSIDAPDRPSESISHWPGRTNVVEYGITTWGDLFTDRQLVALTTFSDLVLEAREKVLADALAASMDADAPRLAEGGTGAQAYADAVATYFGLAIDKAADLGNSLCAWEPIAQCPRHLFARQAIPMVWDFAEANLFSESSGSWMVFCEGLAKSVVKSFALTNLITSEDRATQHRC